MLALLPVLALLATGAQAAPARDREPGWFDDLVNKFKSELSAHGAEWSTETGFTWATTVDWNPGHHTTAMSVTSRSAAPSSASAVASAAASSAYPSQVYNSTSPGGVLISNSTSSNSTSGTKSNHGHDDHDDDNHGHGKGKNDKHSSSSSSVVKPTNVNNATSSAHTSSVSHSISAGSKSSASASISAASSMSKPAASSVSKPVTNSTSMAAASSTSKVSNATPSTTVKSSSTSVSSSSTKTSTSASSTSTLDADAAKFLKLHNDFRAEYGASALTWNSTLATYAKKESDSCTYGHTGGPYGENIAAGVGGGYDLTTGFNSWASEASLYNYSNPGYSEKTGHFTQVVWKSTTQLGCAVTSCPSGSIFSSSYNNPNIYVVCEYAPAGNIVNDGYFKANVGEHV